MAMGNKKGENVGYVYCIHFRSRFLYILYALPIVCSGFMNNNNAHIKRRETYEKPVKHNCIIPKRKQIKIQLEQGE